MVAEKPPRHTLTRVCQYTAYVAAISLLNSLVVYLTMEEFGFGQRGGDPRNTMMFLPMALTFVPHAVLQVVVAALVIKPLSLWRLFGVSAVFLLGSVLLVGFASHSPWSAIRWISLWVYTTSFGNFGLLIPVLILALAGWHRARCLAASSSVVTSPDLSDKPPMPQPRDAPSESKWRWYYWDLALAAVLLWFEIILDPWGVFGYLGGLINVPFSREGFMLSVAVAPWTLLCPVVLLVRMLVVWPRRLHSWRRLVLAWGIVVGAFVAGFVLPFRLPVTRSWDAFMAGFQQHVQRRVDIPAVQEWLATLKPGPRRPGYANPDLHVEDADLPRAIARLNAWHWDMRFDDRDRPMIRLSWGSGVMGGWGLVVGDEQMETPPSDFSQYGEVRRTVAPGAYVWYDMK